MSPPLLDPATRDLYEHSASAGHPPPPDSVAEAQLGLSTPWHWREHFLPILRSINPDTNSEKALHAIECSRGHGKSKAVHLLVLYAAQYILPHLDVQPENRRIVLVGREQAHVTGNIMQGIEEAIAAYAPWLKLKDWKDLTADEVLASRATSGRTWGSTRFDLTNGVSIRGRTINQGFRGEHGYLFIVDDLIDENNFLESPHFYDLIDGSILPTVEFGGTVLVVGTPQSQDDLYDLLAKDPQWSTVRLPAIDEDGTRGYRAMNEKAIDRGWLPASAITQDRDLDCLWPQRYNYDGLLFERGKTPAKHLKFEREYLLRRNTEAGSLVDPNDIARCKDPTISYEQTGTYGHHYHGGADPSSLAHSDAACIVGIVDAEGRRIPTHIRTLTAGSIKQDPETAVAAMFHEVSQAFNHPNLFIEANQYQGVLKPLLTDRDAFHNITRYTLGSQKHTEAGWLMIRTLFRNGKVRLPYGPTASEQQLIDEGSLRVEDCHARRTTDTLVAQIRNVNYIDGKIITAKGAKDDLVSALFLFFKATENVVTGHYLSTAPARRPSTTHTSTNRNRQAKPRTTRDRLAFADRLRRSRNL